MRSKESVEDVIIGPLFSIRYYLQIELHVERGDCFDVL